MFTSCTRSLHECTTSGGTCVTVFDGLYLVCAVCLAIGFVTVAYMRKTLVPLQNTHISHWTDVRNEDLEYAEKPGKEMSKKFC